MTELIITSSVLILVIVTLRFCLRGRISARLQYALWAFVALRLLLPFALFESPVSVMNFLPQTSTATQSRAYPPANRVENAPASPALGQPPSLPVAEGGTNDMDFSTIATAIWLCGAVLCGTVFLSANLRMSRRLRKSRLPMELSGCKPPVYTAEGLSSPCLYGLWKPAIYLTPQSMGDTQRVGHILAHEQTHYRHKDHLFALLRVVCVCLHWYNPLVWFAAVLSKQDSELACDESTLVRLGDESRIAYGKTLIEMMAAAAKPSDLFYCATTMSGAKGELVQRLRRIAKKPKMLAIAVLAVALVTVTTVAATFGGAVNTQSSSDVPFAQQLWNARTEYVGSASAVGKLVELLPVPQGLEYDHFELHTSAEPYEIKIIYKATPEVFAQYDRDGVSEVANPFRRNALVLLALVDNVNSIRATIQSGGRTSNFTNMRSWAEETVGGDVRRFAQSPNQVAELLEFPLGSEVSFDDAMRMVKAIYPEPLIVEADGDRTIVGDEVGYTFNVSAPVAQENTATKEYRLIHSVGVVKSNGQLWKYSTDTGKWAKENPTKPEAALTEQVANSYYAGQGSRASQILQSGMLARMLDQWTDDAIGNPKWNVDSFTRYQILNQNMDSTSEEELYYCTFSADNGKQYFMVLRYDPEDGGGLGKVSYSETPYAYDLRAVTEDIAAKLSLIKMDLSTAVAVRVAVVGAGQNSTREAIQITDGAGNKYFYYFDEYGK